MSLSGDPQPSLKREPDASTLGTSEHLGLSGGSGLPGVGQLCKGSGRGGVMPGATKNSAEEWQRYKGGELRCPRCQRYIVHDDKGRLIDHVLRGT